MSKPTSPSGKNSYGAISPTASNTKAARASLSPPGSVVTMTSMADDLSVSHKQDSSDESDNNDFTSEKMPLVTSPTINVTENGSSKTVRRRVNEYKIRDLPDTVRCDCHEPPKPADKASRNRLMIACVVVLIFMIGEVVGSLRLKLGQGVN